MNLRGLRLGNVRSRVRGVALVLTLIAIVIISAVLFTAMSIVTYDARAGLQDQSGDQALYFARYGIAYIESQLAQQGALYNAITAATSTLSPGAPAPFDTTGLASTLLANAEGFNALGNTTIGQAPTLTIEISKAQNSGLGLGQYNVSSTATLGHYTRTLDVLLQDQTFADYALFTGANQQNFVSGQTVNGAVYSNAHFNILGNPAFDNKVLSANADEASTASPKPGNFPYDPTAHTYDQTVITFPATITGAVVSSDTSTFYHPITGNYSNDFPSPAPSASAFSFAGGQPSIPMTVNNAFPPIISSADTEQTKVGGPLQNTAVFTGDTVFQFQNDGSIKVFNNTGGFPPSTAGVATATISVAAVTSGNVVLLVQSGDAYIQEKAGSPGLAPNTSITIAAQTDPQFPVAGGLQNNGTQGATGSNPGAPNGNIIIQTNITYSDKPAGTTTYAGKSALGLVADNNVLIQPNAAINEIDGAIMAVNGGIAVQTQPNGSTPDMGSAYYAGGFGPQYTTDLGSVSKFGNLLFFGSSANQAFEPKGTVAPGVTPPSLQTGFLSQFAHDDRFTTTPPPDFPSTGSVKVMVLADEGAYH